MPAWAEKMGAAEVVAGGLNWCSQSFFTWTSERSLEMREKPSAFLPFHEDFLSRSKEYPSNGQNWRSTMNQGTLCFALKGHNRFGPHGSAPSFRQLLLAAMMSEKRLNCLVSSGVSDLPRQGQWSSQYGAAQRNTMGNTIQWSIFISVPIGGGTCLMCPPWLHPICIYMCKKFSKTVPTRLLWCTFGLALWVYYFLIDYLSLKALYDLGGHISPIYLCLCS